MVKDQHLSLWALVSLLQWYCVSSSSSSTLHPSVSYPPVVHVPCCCLCRPLQPRSRCGWYPSATDANDCATSNSCDCYACYWWAHPTESMESAAAGAAFAHTQTGTEQERNEYGIILGLLPSKGIHNTMISFLIFWCLQSTKTESTQIYLYINKLEVIKKVLE